MESLSINLSSSSSKLQFVIPNLMEKKTKQCMLKDVFLAICILQSNYCCVRNDFEGIIR